MCIPFWFLNKDIISVCYTEINNIPKGWELQKLTLYQNVVALTWSDHQNFQFLAQQFLKTHNFWPIWTIGGWNEIWNHSKWKFDIYKYCLINKNFCVKWIFQNFWIQIFQKFFTWNPKNSYLLVVPNSAIYIYLKVWKP